MPSFAGLHGKKDKRLDGWGPYEQKKERKNTNRAPQSSSSPLAMKCQFFFISKL